MSPEESCQPFFLGLNGSPFKDGIVVEIMNALLHEAERTGAETKLVHLYDLEMIPEKGLYSENPARAVKENMPDDDMLSLYPEIERADALVLGTPVYWANMSAVMKNFIEHLTPLENDGFKLEGKLAAFIAASKEDEGGRESAVMSMVSPLGQMGALIPPNAIIWYPGSWYTSGKSYENWAFGTAKDVGRSMVHLIRVLKEHPIKWS
ncbi:MAG: flavodoxin family protein [bacterium]|nr:flavodoxin family protein [bacterium]